MIELDTVVAARDLVSRFAGFFDAVLIDVHLSLSRSAAARYGVITLLAQTLPSDGWRTVVLRVDGLNEYRLTEGPDTYLVLSDGLQIHGAGENDGKCILDLSPGGAEQAGLRAGSGQFLSGSKCSYEVGDISE